ncbi:MAG: carbohydrate ABC transporter permease [Clostridia bacterium]
MNSSVSAVKRPLQKKYRKPVDGLKVFTWFMLTLWTLMICGVLIIAISFSFKSSVEIFQNPWSLPSSIDIAIRNYVKAWSTSQMGTYLFNSILIVTASLLISLLVSAMAAYVLTRFHFWGRKLLTALLILGMGVPLQLMVIPLYKLMSSFAMTDTYQGLVIVYATVCIPFTAFVLTGFFSSIPEDVIEAATMDGCSQNRLFWKIVMPLAKPGLIAVSSFNFVWIWNEYLLALVFTSKKSLRTISLGMYALQGSMTYTVDWGALFAGVVIMLIPAAIIFVILNKYIISGVTVGAVKG